jgi:hypothetical protein
LGLSETQIRNIEQIQQKKLRRRRLSWDSGRRSLTLENQVVQDQETKTIIFMHTARQTGAGFKGWKNKGKRKIK